MIDINKKYEGDYLTADEFNLLVQGINNLKLGDISNISANVDNAVTSESVLVKGSGEDKFTLKKLSDLVSSVGTLGDLSNVQPTVDEDVEDDSDFDVPPFLRDRDEFQIIACNNLFLKKKEV